ncbi:hypothetical protein [Aliihoeflea sp. PC F10.4]
MNHSQSTPPVRDTEATGVPESNKRDLMNTEADQDSKAPKTSGVPERGKEPFINKTVDRNTEGAREAGATPRPTDKPIVGGDKGSAA